MTDETPDVPPEVPADATPPEPPASAPPPPPSAGGGGDASASVPSDNRNVMIVLAYLYFFCLVPLFAEKEDQEVQWHGKHGLVLLGADIALAVTFTVLSAITGGLLGCLLFPFWALLHFALFVVRIVAIVKGTQGDRLVIPGLTGLVDQF